MRIPLISVAFLACVSLSAQDKEVRDWSLSLEKEGIGLEEAYSELLSETPKNDIIVAIIDSSVDISHPDLQGSIYINKGEIPDNNIDDDNNGYVDDVHGWNFLGYQRDKTYLEFPYPHIMIIQQHYDHLAGLKGASKVDPALLNIAKLAYEKKRKSLEQSIERRKLAFDSYVWLRKNYSNVFPNDNSYTDEKLDSIGNLSDINAEHIANLGFLTYEVVGPREVKREYMAAIEQYSIYNNVNNRDWMKIVDTIPYSLEDKGRGHGFVQARTDKSQHGTEIATVIGATRGNQMGIRGIGNNIKVMPLVVINNASARDKDFYNAVVYAVDNGAKVINYSFGKDIVENQDVYYKAIKYAKDHDVLFVCAAGNEGKNIDLPEFSYYPGAGINKNDLDNFMKVGSMEENFSKGPEYFRSNYGKSGVDIYAPGIFVAVGYPLEYYLPYHSGSSISSAITAGSAALLRSLYPEMSASEIKKVLMDTGRTYSDIEISTRYEGKVKFSEMSVSGKVLNIFNAIKYLQNK